MMSHAKFWLMLMPLAVWGASSPKSASTLDTPALPAIRSIELQPTSLNLRDVRDERRVLVLGKTDNGTVDLTALASFKTDSPMVEIVEGHIRARQKGSAEIGVSAAG